MLRSGHLLCLCFLACPTTHSIAFPPMFLIASSRLAPPAKVSSSMPLDVGTVTVCRKLEVLTMREGSFDVA